MADARYTCPDCGSIDLLIEKSGLVDAEGGSTSKAQCPNCGWEGKLSDTVGFVTSENLWDIERVGNVLIRVMAVNAAGPLVQALEFIGLLPKKVAVPEDPEGAVAAKRHNELAQKARDAVMQRVCATAVTAAFEEAEAQHRMFAVESNTPLHPVLVDPDDTPTVRTRSPGKKKKR